MKTTCRSRRVACWVGWLLWTGFLMVPPALAAEGGGSDWRPLYDLVMRWVNFLILAFLIVKFARVPLKNFLRGKRDEIAAEVQEMERRRREAMERLEKMRREVETNAASLDRLRSRLAAQGERRKEEIVALAEAECEILLTAAQSRIEGEIARARATVRAEMIDAAVELAVSRLPAVITPADNQALLNRYFEETE